MRRLARRVLRRLLQSADREPVFASSDVVCGRNVRFGRNVVFRASRVRIGDGTIIEDNVTVDSSVFEIGDYGTVYGNCFFPGPGELRIGHNFWLGTGSIVDCKGGTSIGNNVGIGAHSQLWTHMAFGDVLAGCRFDSARSLDVGDDVWFVGHCLVSPIRAGTRSLAMLGSVVTRDMEADRCYAGVPAVDITDKVGPQFRITAPAERASQLDNYLREYAAASGDAAILQRVAVSTAPGDMLGFPAGVLVFNVADRTYTKHGAEWENGLIRSLLPRAKFVPVAKG